MSKISLNLDKSKKYVVACSFGPDSMALLSAAIQEGLDIVVAHVNYRKREEAIFEQKSLEKYCFEKGVKIYTLDLLGKHHVGNFQEWARETRYKFFKNVAEQVKADAVLVAHQEDDAIETYLMQKNRGNIVKNPGITVENDLFGIKILRPLLSYSKQELKDFDDENRVPYAIDKSNLSDAYTRNKIRHQIVEKMDTEKRSKIIEEMRGQYAPEIEFKTEWQNSEFEKLSYEQVVRLLDQFMNATKTHRDLSEKFVSEIKKAFGSKINCSFKITDRLILEKDYDCVYLVNAAKITDYQFSFVGKLSNSLFDIDFENGAEDRKIPKDVKKLVVKNIDKNSKLIIKNYKSSINRLFIDWKVPHYLREVWPGIYDEKGTLLYVPRYRKDFVDNHKSKFVFRTEYFTKF